MPRGIPIGNVFALVSEYHKPKSQLYVEPHSSYWTNGKAKNGLSTKKNGRPQFLMEPSEKRTLDVDMDYVLTSAH